MTNKPCMADKAKHKKALYFPAINPYKKTKRERRLIKRGVSIFGDTDFKIVDFASFKSAIRAIMETPGRIKNRVMHGFCDRDTWDIGYWFIKVMPEMLIYLRDNRHGSPDIWANSEVSSHALGTHGDCHEEWTKVLNRMIHLLREMDRETCSKKNPYAGEYEKASDEFEKKYGVFGERFGGNEGQDHTMHLLGEDPEYADIDRKYMDYEQKLREYRNRCKDQFFEMFSKHFWQLWD